MPEGVPTSVTKETPTPEPRLIDFTLNEQLQGILKQHDSQMVNIIGGGNVPEGAGDLIPVLFPDEARSIAALKAKGTQEAKEEADRLTLKLSKYLQSVDDLPVHMQDTIREHNIRMEDPEYAKGKRKIRMVDTPARIQEQFIEIKQNIQTFVQEQIGEKQGVQNIVFTVCGASPPDLQIVRAIQALNEEYQGTPKLFASIFLPGNEDAVIPYSVATGLHAEFWEEVYKEIKKDPNIFIHEPHAVGDSLGDVVPFQTVRETSKAMFGHNRAGNVDINRTITEMAAEPPMLGIFAEAGLDPNQFPGSGLDLILRQLWYQTVYKQPQISFDDAWENIRIVQHGFLETLPVNKEKLVTLLKEKASLYQAEHDAGIWPRAQKMPV